MSRREIIQELESIRKQTKDLGTFITLGNLIEKIIHKEDEVEE